MDVSHKFHAPAVLLSSHPTRDLQPSKDSCLLMDLTNLKVIYLTFENHTFISYVNAKYMHTTQYNTILFMCPLRAMCIK